MYNQINYDAMGRQQAPALQLTQQQQQIMTNIRLMQISKLQKAYPEMQLHKETYFGTEYRVPLIIISSSLLNIKVTIGPQFPYVKPIIQVMSKVTHPTIEP